jgi:retron-type reverse transcriptase
VDAPPQMQVLDKQRPLTIPSFMDKVIQKVINLILEAIYEPYFDHMNCSFGLRLNKGTLDVITDLLSKKTNGIWTAVEGDIEAAYDAINKGKLIDCLNKRITYNKFLKLIKQRLNYNYVVKNTNFFNPQTGIPQGRIDSPYL